MGFKFDLRKMQQIQKGTREQALDTLDKLHGHIAGHEDAPARILAGTWDMQQGDMTYQEIENAIAAGALTDKYLRDWQQQYATIIESKFAPLWADSMEIGAKTAASQYPAFYYNAEYYEIKNYIKSHGSKLVVDMSASQVKAINFIIENAAVLGDFDVAEASRIIRSIVGLTSREAAAVYRYADYLQSEGMSQKKALQQAEVYSQRLHRARAMRIARTEIAYGYNYGGYFGIQEAQGQGLIGDTEKTWITADDERMCEICGGMDGQTVDLHSSFISRANGQAYFLPPAHPHCRCGVGYRQKRNAVIRIY
jgi:hypothetical protein